MGYIFKASTLCVVALAACSSLSTVESTRPVPPEYVVATAGNACAVIIRGRSRQGSRRSLVLIDGREVARIGGGEHLRFCAPPGEHLIEIRNTAILRRASTDARSWIARSGEVSYFRLNDSRLLPTTESSAMPKR